LEKSKENIETTLQALQKILRIVQSFNKGIEHVFDARLSPLFDYVNETIPRAQERDPQLAFQLKRIFSSLASPRPKGELPNIFGSEKEKLFCLIEELSTEENETVNFLCSSLQNYRFSDADLRRLAKLLVTGSALSRKNTETLRDAFRNASPHKPCVHWDNKEEVLQFLQLFKGNESDVLFVGNLCRIGKWKAFFKGQENLGEDQIFIPRWYHATEKVADIISSGKILFNHEHRMRGAWVSTRREPMFGHSVFGFSPSILQIGLPHDGRNSEEYKWRGIQQPIPLFSNLGLIGVPQQEEKAATKKLKEQTRELLQKGGLSSVRVVSNNQLDFIQKRIEFLVNNLRGDHRYFTYQTALHRKMLQSGPHCLTSTNSAHDQIAIASILQMEVLPVHKLSFNDLDTHAVDATKLMRKNHDTMHCVRTALWTQAFSCFYEQTLGKPSENKIMIALAGAFHDSARQDDGESGRSMFIHRVRRGGRGNGHGQRAARTSGGRPEEDCRDLAWNQHGGELLNTFLLSQHIPEQQRLMIVQAVKEKDPSGNRFSSDAQRVLHDADYIESCRPTLYTQFDPKGMCLPSLAPEHTEQANRLLEEMQAFILLTENEKIKLCLEHTSQDAYGDLVRFLFHFQDRFPTLTNLLKRDMSEILATEGTPLLTAIDTKEDKSQSDGNYQEALQGKVRLASRYPLTSEYTTHDQLVIGRVVQSVAVPLYKIPFKDAVSKNINPRTIIRGPHGTMHCVRTAVWTQVFARFYERVLGRTRVDPILTALSGAFHDAGREGDGPDLWDRQSGELLDTFLLAQGISEQQRLLYVQAIKEKDPDENKFSSDPQRIAHDADCVDIVRVRGANSFEQDFLCASSLAEVQGKKEVLNRLIEEMKDFIALTESHEVQFSLEYESEDAYGDLVRLLFRFKDRFPTITSLIQDDMREIIKQ
jgi:hypothetical protein